MSENISTPKTFEEQALAFVGKELYEAFFKGYIEKQWGTSPDQLPASILKRLPLRFDYDDRYFNHPYQAISKEGYTPLFEKLLDHYNISLHINTSFNPKDASQFEHVFYSGPLDGWFVYDLGRLPYRTLDFQKEVFQEIDNWQGIAVMNYPDKEVTYTRITEHKHFSPWEEENIRGTVIYKEYSRTCEAGNIPYYPVRLIEGQTLLNEYEKRAQTAENVTFIGRLGTYQYLDMDVTISLALKVANKFKNKI